MRKFRTYGKKGREIYVNVGDQFDYVSNDSGSERASPRWIKAFSTKGWCQPTSKFPSCSLVASGGTPFDNEEMQQITMASTPCSSGKGNTRTCRNFQKQIFNREILSKKKQTISDKQSNTESDSFENMNDVTDRLSMKSDIVSPIVHDIGDLSLDMTRSLGVDKETSRPDSIEDILIIDVKEKCQISTSTPDCAERMTFLESLTPYQLQDVINETKRTFSIDHDCTSEGKILNLCEQEKIIDIKDYFVTRNVVKKIGEGLYGEVFEVGGNKIAKVVPVEGSLLVNGEPQKSFSEMLSEIVISKELTALSAKSNHDNLVDGFIKLMGAKCCKGRYPVCLLDHWVLWNLERGSDNDNPEKFHDDQLYVILETEYGGISLEDYRRVTAAEAKSILHQVTSALAVGEVSLKFEHRDLHWGNVLIRETENKMISYVINGERKTIITAGIEVRIIDFTLSRLEKDECVVFANLSDDENLFQGVGDYQFDLYRMMRNHNRNCWYEFKAKTNIFWIHYIADKLWNEKLIRKTKKLKQFCNRINEYHCSIELLTDKYFLD